MSNIIDRVFNEVCLDSKIPDGIFKMEENNHMEVLRDYFIKKGITKEAAIHVTNKMLEGKYPERQTYRKEDGILVTFPSPQHKAKAMAKNPGKYTDQDPKPKKPEAVKEPFPANSSNSSKPFDKEPIPSKEPEPKNPVFPTEPSAIANKKVNQNGKELEVEPPRGEEKPEPPPQPSSPPVDPIPQTPERIAAEKEIAKQIMNTDDSVLTNVANPLNIHENLLTYQLNELYRKADEWGFREAITFLTPYIKS